MVSYQVSTFFISVVLTFQLVGGFQNSIRRVTLCKNEEPVSFHCTNNSVITVLKTESGNIRCNSQKSTCNSKLYKVVIKLCSGNVTCNLTSDIFPAECTGFRRYLETKVECSRFWGSYRTFSECSDSLPNIKCSWPHHIHVQRVTIKSNEECSPLHSDKNCPLKRMKHLCNEQRSCSSDNDRSSCLHERTFVNIFYTCTENTTEPLQNSSNDANPTVFPEIDSTENLTTADTWLEIDNEGRLLVTIGTNTMQKVLCVDNWDNKAATVVCNWLNKTSIGKAIKLSNPDEYSVIDVAINCSGQETSLLKCGLIEKNCSLSTSAAGVVCCDDNASCAIDPPLSVTSDFPPIISPPSKSVINNEGLSNTGIVLGTAFAVIMTVVTILVFVYFQRRGYITYKCIYKSRTAKTSTQGYDDDYAGQQGIALPESSMRNTKLKYQIQYNKEDNAIYANQAKNGCGSPPNTPLYSLASNDEDQSAYATSQDDEYDNTHDKRHIAIDVKVYEHTVDTVYDIADNRNKKISVDNTYGRTVDNVYDRSSHQRAEDKVVDVYSRAVETAYDVSDCNKHREKDTYNHT